jgi:glucose/mannose-6-phosphate isomerase
MKFIEVLERVPEYAEESLKHCARVGDDFDNVLITGMGGSGVVGSILQEFLYDRLNKPIVVSKSPLVPRFCNERTLHLLISYSGNTAETLSAFESSRGKKICITSGGTLAGMSDNVIKVPGGFLPRQALYHMLIPALGLFYDPPAEIPAWLRKTREQREEARRMARKIGDRTPLIYGAHPFSSLALRFKQQINENCKTRAFFNCFPEMNHNEIESFHNSFRDYIAVSINGCEESLDVIRERCDALVFELYGDDELEKLFRGLYFIDLVTCYLAELRGVDPAAMPNIDRLKAKR